GAGGGDDRPRRERQGRLQAPQGRGPGAPGGGLRTPPPTSGDGPGSWGPEPGFVVQPSTWTKSSRASSLPPVSRSVTDTVPEEPASATQRRCPVSKCSSQSGSRASPSTKM